MVMGASHEVQVVPEEAVVAEKGNLLHRLQVPCAYKKVRAHKVFFLNVSFSPEIADLYRKVVYRKTVGILNIWLFYLSNLEWVGEILKMMSRILDFLIFEISGRPGN